MKKALSLILALVMCLSLCACGDTSENDLSDIVCGNTWVSSDHINYIDTIDRKIVYTTLSFFGDGTCKYICEDYREGKLTDTTNLVRNWKIENGKIAVFPDAVDSDTDTIYYEYSEGKLIGSAWYCDRFTYTQGTPANTTTSNNEETTETTPQAICYPDTQFPTIESVIEEMNCDPTVIQEDLCVRYRYTHKNLQVNDYYNINGEYQNFSKSYKNDILSQFKQEEYIHIISDTISYSYAVWFDGAGHALMVEGKLIESMWDGNYYNLDICIISEDNVQAYVDTLD